MSAELIERLRTNAVQLDGHPELCMAALDAADRIVALEAKVEELERQGLAEVLRASLAESKVQDLEAENRTLRNAGVTAVASIVKWLWKQRREAADQAYEATEPATKRRRTEYAMTCRAIATAIELGDPWPEKRQAIPSNNENHGEVKFSG